MVIFTIDMTLNSLLLFQICSHREWFICVLHFCLAVCIVGSFLAMMCGAFSVMSFMIHFLFQVIEFGRRAHFDASKILPCKLEYVGLSTTEYCFTLPRIVGELSMYCVLILSLFLYASHLWIFYFILYVFGYLWWHNILSLQFEFLPFADYAYIMATFVMLHHTQCKNFLSV